MMESPEEASEMACPMVLQAIWDDMQLLLSLPLTPFTYRVVLARAVEAMARNIAISSSLARLNLITCLPAEICLTMPTNSIDGTLLPRRVGHC